MKERSRLVKNSRTCEEADDQAYENDREAVDRTVPHVRQRVEPLQSRGAAKERREKGLTRETTTAKTKLCRPRASYLRVTLLSAVWMAVVVLLDSRMAPQLGGGGLGPELRVTMLPMPTQKAKARPAPRPAKAPW